MRNAYIPVMLHHFLLLKKPLYFGRAMLIEGLLVVEIVSSYDCVQLEYAHHSTFHCFYSMFVLKIETHFIDPV